MLTRGTTGLVLVAMAVQMLEITNKNKYISKQFGLPKEGVFRYFPSKIDNNLTKYINDGKSLLKRFIL